MSSREGRLGQSARRPSLRIITMNTVNPGQTTTISIGGFPAGDVVGFQVVKAATNSTVIGRTTNGVVERPAGTGNYVINFIAPPEGDLYLVIVDNNDGILDVTAKVEQLQVTMDVQPGSTGLGAIADYAKVNLGGETWKLLTDSNNFGTVSIRRAIETVKARVQTSPTSLADESNLPPLVLDYFGICTALELIPAARDAWGSQIISQSIGNEPAEIVTFTDRSKMMNDLRYDLMRRYAQAQQLALPLIEGPVVLMTSDGPLIDEDFDDARATDDPRTFPRLQDYPYPHRPVIL